MNDAGAMAHCHCGDEATVEAPDRLTGTTRSPVDRCGAAVIDRIISIIDAVRSASRMGREIESDEFSMEPGGKLRFTVDPLASRQLCVTFCPGF